MSVAFVTPPAELLSAHNLFRTTSLDEARDEVAKVFCPHRLVTTSRTGAVDTVHNRVRLGHLSINYLDYGAEVEIDPGELSSFFLIQIPLAGVSSVTCDRTTVISTRLVKSVCARLLLLVTLALTVSPHQALGYLLLHISLHLVLNHMLEVRLP